MFFILGMEGYVKNDQNEPLRSATIAVTGVDQQYKVSKNMAFYKIMLPPGDYKVIIRCHGYTDQVNILPFIFSAPESKLILKLKISSLSFSST